MPLTISKEEKKEDDYHTVININFQKIGISLVQNFNEI